MVLTFPGFLMILHKFLLFISLNYFLMDVLQPYLVSESGWSHSSRNVVVSVFFSNLDIIPMLIVGLIFSARLFGMFCSRLDIWIIFRPDRIYKLSLQSASSSFSPWLSIGSTSKYLSKQFVSRFMCCCSPFGMFMNSP